MVIKITISAIILAICVFLVKDNLIDLYYSIAYKEEVNLVIESLTTISNSDINAARRYVDSNSKLLHPNLFQDAGICLKKVNIASMRVSKVIESHESDNHFMMIKIFFDKNSDAMVTAVLQNDPNHGLKVRDIFFNDYYFLD